MDQDPTSTADLFANWPATVPFYLYGVNLSSGVTGPFPSGVCQTSATDPYQYGFYEYEPTGNPCTRTFWTQPCFLFATQGLGTNFAIAGANGQVTFNTSTTAYSWSNSTSGPFSYMANVASQASLVSQVCVLERIAGTNWC
jgi:hypothetical protein